MIKWAGDVPCVYWEDGSKTQRTGHRYVIFEYDPKNDNMLLTEIQKFIAASQPTCNTCFYYRQGENCGNFSLAYCSLNLPLQRGTCECSRFNLKMEMDNK